MIVGRARCWCGRYCEAGALDCPAHNSAGWFAAMVESIIEDLRWRRSRRRIARNVRELMPIAGRTCDAPKETP